MMQRGNTLKTKSNDVSLIPRTYTVGRKNGLPIAALCNHIFTMAHACQCTQYIKCKKKGRGKEVGKHEGMV